MAEAQKRKITKKDWERVEKFVGRVYDERKNSTHRKSHESKWKEIDRQIEMSPMTVVDEAGKERKPDWHNVLELGELSKASEIITSDVMRIMLPDHWFEPTVEVPWPLDPQTGQPKSDSEHQKIADGVVRSLMEQQHLDFGFKARVRLSIKEALHHGSFVAETRFDNEMMAKEGGKLRMIGAPVWVPYSMWNSFPDPSPSVIGTNMFYTGSMVLREFMPLWKLKQIAKGDGWMRDRLDKVEETTNKNGSVETKDIEIIKYLGDVSIDRSDGDIFLPNSKVMLANGKIIYYAANELPYPNVIMGGYERQDIRDPYYTSPIIKQSPMQKFTTIMANKFADAVALKVEPPIEYDGTDPDYAANGGPRIAPGASSSSKSMGNGFKVLDIGDPRFALEALQMGLSQMQEGTGVSAVRSGMTNSDRQTATEVRKTAQGAEVRTIEFIAQLEPAIRSYLYMQHELNRAHLKDYSFKCDEMHSPDFMRFSKKDVDFNAGFEIVGSRGVLGEEERSQKSTAVTAFAAQSPLFAPKLKPSQLLIKMYRDAGEKNPEDFVQVDQPGQQGPDPAAQQAQMQMQEQIQEAQKQIQQKEQQLEKVKEQLQKQGNDQALKEQKLTYETQLLALKKQLQDKVHQMEVGHTTREIEHLIKNAELDLHKKDLSNQAKVEKSESKAEAKSPEPKKEEKIENVAKLIGDHMKEITKQLEGNKVIKAVPIKNAAGRMVAADITYKNGETRRVTTH